MEPEVDQSRAEILRGVTFEKYDELNEQRFSDDEAFLLESGAFANLVRSHQRLLSAKLPRKEYKQLKKTQKEYYGKQNELLKQYEQDHRTLVEPEWDERMSRRGTSDNRSINSDVLETTMNRSGMKMAKLLLIIGVNASFVTNVVLLVLKLFAAIASGSMTVIASAMDSFLDILSGLILFVTTWLMQRKNPEKYPVGKARMEPLGTIVFSCVMAMAAMQLVIESITILMGSPRYPDIGIATLAILGSTVVAKSVLYLYCRFVGDYLSKKHFEGSSSLSALQSDHRNDVLTNSFGIMIAVIASQFRSLWWADSVGAIVLSLYIVATWARTAYEQIVNITGKAASPLFVQRVMYLSTMHHPDILSIETVRSFYLGNSIFVELHVVLPPEMPLHIAHDIGESLERKIERLDEVEMAVVHLDCDDEHMPMMEHLKSKEAAGITSSKLTQQNSN